MRQRQTDLWSVAVMKAGVTDQTVGEGEGMFGQKLPHVRLAFLHLKGEPGTPQVLKQEVHQFKLTIGARNQKNMLAMEEDELYSSFIRCFNYLLFYGGRV